MLRSKSHILFLLLMAVALILGTDLCFADSADSSETTTVAEQQGESEAPVFERRKHQRHYEKTLRRVERMKAVDGSETSPDDWFVVGGAIGDGTVNFDVFQGTKNVARRVVEFTTAYDNQCEWRIFHRSSEQSVARELLVDVKSEYENLLRRQKQLAEAQRRAQRQQARAGRARCGPRG